MTADELKRLEEGAELALQAVDDMYGWATKFLEQVYDIGKESRLLLDEMTSQPSIPKGAGYGRILSLPPWRVNFAILSNGDTKGQKLNLRAAKTLPQKVVWFGVAFKVAGKWCPKLISGVFRNLKESRSIQKDKRQLLGDLIRLLLEKDEVLRKPKEQIEGNWLRGDYEIDIQPLLGAVPEDQLDEVAQATVERMIKWAS